MKTTVATLERRVRGIPATKASETLRQDQGGQMRVAAYCLVSINTEEQLNSYEAQKLLYSEDSG